mmetsp:Transcript_26761/g.70269  ORF Transcript_26761/g.70269 Transcript_26761/m.70269 type:complete len:117 (-) Transcript_26761:194-544(-)
MSGTHGVNRNILFVIRIRTARFAGTVKDLVTNLLGMGLFGDFPFRPLNMVALAISFFGSAWYTRLKYLASVSVSSQVEICRIAQLQENSECDGVEDSDPSNRNGDLMIDKDEDDHC